MLKVGLDTFGAFGLRSYDSHILGNFFLKGHLTQGLGCDFQYRRGRLNQKLRHFYYFHRYAFLGVREDYSADFRNPLVELFFY